MTMFQWVWWNWNIIYDLRLMLLYPFVDYEFEAGTIIAVVAGAVGYLVVVRRSSFATHALGHIGFSGAAGAVLLGTQAILAYYGLLASTTVTGSAIGLLGKKAAHRDVEIGTILAVSLAFGLFFISLYNGYATLAYSILFGQVTGINPEQVWLTLLTGVAVLGLLAILYRPLLFASLDEEVAEAKGVPTTLLAVAFMIMLAVTISIAVTVIGVLLSFAVTVTPAAVAMRLAKRPLTAVLISVGVALFGVWAGIFVAFYENAPASFFIVIIVFLIYLAVRAVLPAIQSVRGRLRTRRRLQPTV